jgi:hypothetical protein
MITLCSLQGRRASSDASSSVASVEAGRHRDSRGPSRPCQPSPLSCAMLLGAHKQSCLDQAPRSSPSVVALIRSVFTRAIRESQRTSRVKSLEFCGLDQMHLLESRQLLTGGDVIVQLGPTVIGGVERQDVFSRPIPTDQIAGLEHAVVKGEKLDSPSTADRVRATEVFAAPGDDGTTVSISTAWIAPSEGTIEFDLPTFLDLNGDGQGESMVGFAVQLADHGSDGSVTPEYWQSAQVTFTNDPPAGVQHDELISADLPVSQSTPTDPISFPFVPPAGTQFARLQYEVPAGVDSVQVVGLRLGPDQRPVPVAMTAIIPAARDFDQGILVPTDGIEAFGFLYYSNLKVVYPVLEIPVTESAVDASDVNPADVSVLNTAPLVPSSDQLSVAASLDEAALSRTGDSVLVRSASVTGAATLRVVFTMHVDTDGASYDKPIAATSALAPNGSYVLKLPISSTGTGESGPDGIGCIYFDSENRVVNVGTLGSPLVQATIGSDFPGQVTPTDVRILAPSADGTSYGIEIPADAKAVTLQIPALENAVQVRMIESVPMHDAEGNAYEGPLRATAGVNGNQTLSVDINLAVQSIPGAAFGLTGINREELGERSLIFATFLTQEVAGAVPADYVVGNTTSDNSGLSLAIPADEKLMTAAHLELPAFPAGAKTIRVLAVQQAEGTVGTVYDAPFLATGSLSLEHELTVLLPPDSQALDIQYLSATNQIVSTINQLAYGEFDNNTAGSVSTSSLVALPTSDGKALAGEPPAGFFNQSRFPVSATVTIPVFEGARIRILFSQLNGVVGSEVRATDALPLQHQYVVNLSDGYAGLAVVFEDAQGHRLSTPTLTAFVDYSSQGPNNSVEHPAWELMQPAQIGGVVRQDVLYAPVSSLSQIASALSGGLAAGANLRFDVPGMAAGSSVAVNETVNDPRSGSVNKSTSLIDEAAIERASNQIIVPFNNSSSVGLQILGSNLEPAGTSDPVYVQLTNEVFAGAPVYQTTFAQAAPIARKPHNGKPIIDPNVVSIVVDPGITRQSRVFYDRADLLVTGFPSGLPITLSTEMVVFLRSGVKTFEFPGTIVVSAGSPAASLALKSLPGLKALLRKSPTGLGIKMITFRLSGAGNDTAVRAYLHDDPATTTPPPPVKQRRVPPPKQHRPIPRRKQPVKHKPRRLHHATNQATHSPRSRSNVPARARPI